jgi:putative hydrolase of the HAD superfamily
MRIQAVLFDLFETLVTELNAPVRRASSLAAQLGVDESEYKREWKSRRSDVVLGRCTFHDALAQIAAGLGRATDEAVLELLRSERVVQKAGILRAVEPGVLAALGELRNEGLKLAVITNAFAEDVAGWEDSPLRPLFDVTVFSCAAGLAKPDPEIYLAACRALDVMPQQGLFVGDGADEVEGARATGLAASRALWFASRWPQTTIRRNELGLWRLSEVLDAARAA